MNVTEKRYVIKRVKEIAEKKKQLLVKEAQEANLCINWTGHNIDKGVSSFQVSNYTNLLNADVVKASGRTQKSKYELGDIFRKKIEEAIAGGYTNLRVELDECYKPGKDFSKVGKDIQGKLCKLLNTKLGVIDSKVQKITDELMLGDGEEGMKLLKKFEQEKI